MADRHHRTPTAEGKLYLCAIKDASRRIVGYSMADPMTTQLAVDAHHNAVLRRRPAATVSITSPTTRAAVGGVDTPDATVMDRV